jgi:hypothetical protein
LRLPLSAGHIDPQIAVNDIHPQPTVFTSEKTLLLCLKRTANSQHQPWGQNEKACRWSTYQCNKLPPQQRPESCSDPDVPKTIQERAWTSPVWYTAIKE